MYKALKDCCPFCSNHLDRTHLSPLLAERSFLAQDASSGLWGTVAPDDPWGVAEQDGTWLTEPAYSDVQWMSAADVFLATVPEEG